MSEKPEIEEKEDEGNITSPEKCSDEEIRNFQEEPGDDDGENRKPTTHNSMMYTALVILKGTIGAGILNLPLIIRTYGIIGGITVTGLLTIISIVVAYLIGRSKEISQRYSFAVYSKIAMGVTGSVFLKVSLFVMCCTLAIVQLMVFGDVLKGLALLFCNLNERYFIIGIAIVILPFMFQKDISGVTKIAYFGIIGLSIFCVTTIILFFKKYINGQIIFNKSMLFPTKSVTFREKLTLIGGYYNAFTFHFSYFSYYLPLKPRNTKTMMKSVLIGTFLAASIYYLYGVLFFLMYGDSITDSALKYLQKELQESKGKDIVTVIILVICFLSFLVNASISTMIHFYFGKTHFIGLIKFVYAKLTEKKENKDIPLVDIDENRKFSDDVQSIQKKESEDIISDKKKYIITFGLYSFIVLMASTFKKIIILDNFNGSTVANYINLIAPSFFFLYFARKKNCFKDKLMASSVLLFGVGLILMYIVFNFILN